MSTPFDPAAVIAEFIDAVSPYDPSPDAPPVAIVGVRTAFGEATFAVGDHVIRALCRALASYHDPEDRGKCVGCGSRRLDENLHCADCGRLHGILGQVIAQHAARIAAADGAASREERHD
ncbi:MAG TPA: hypothetical protein VGB74_05025 [Actinoplanes sp.]|jgi:hypothetical protein